MKQNILRVEEKRLHSSYNTIQPSLFENQIKFDNYDYLNTQIITYIGNKRKLIPFISKGFEYVKNKLSKDKITILDLFSGTGIVSRMAKQHASFVITNDLENYSYFANKCYMTNKNDFDSTKFDKLFNDVKFQVQNNLTPGFISELYAPKDENNITNNDRVFYTRKNAIYLDTICNVIKNIDIKWRPYFLGPLLSQASTNVNTSGMFKVFHKNKQGVGQYGGAAKNCLTRICKEINIIKPVLSNFECGYEVYQEDANNLVNSVQDVDVAYLDPPYNQHPYGSNYFMLNILCNYKKPTDMSRISGIPKGWNRSLYNKRRHADKALFDVVEKCSAKFVLISYNSEGFISYDQFLTGLKDIGRVSVMDTEYNTFRGCRNLHNRDIHVTEFLYLVDKRG